MENRALSNQRGFTLIEMSIVLVIIGLIVGGILKGQEVIESARQKNMAAMYDQIRAAHGTFIDRYRALPGDYLYGTTRLNAGVGNGDGNGFVGTRYTNAAAIGGGTVNTGENLNYFNALVASGLFGGGQVMDASTTTTTMGNFAGNSGTTPSPLPSAPWSGTGLVMAHGTHEGGTATTSVTALTAPWLRLQTSTAAIAGTAQAALTVGQAFQLDNKLDDGLPWEGRLRQSGVAGTNCDSGELYAVAGAGDARECEMLLAVD